MQYVMQARKAPNQGYGVPVMGFFPTSGPGVMDSRRYSGYTLPGGVGNMGCASGGCSTPRPGLGGWGFRQSASDESMSAALIADMDRQAALPGFSWFDWFGNNTPTPTEQQAVADASQQAAIDPLFGELFTGILSSGTVIGKAFIDSYATRKAAQGASSGVIQGGIDQAMMLASILKGGTPSWLPIAVIGALALVGLGLFARKRRR